MKKATLAFSPVSVAAWRVAGGAAVLALLWFLKRPDWRLRPRDWITVWFVVLVGYAWPYAIQPHLVALHGSAFIGMTVSFVPLMTVLASIPLLKSHPTKRQLIGVVGGLICMAALMAEGLRRQVPLADLALAGTVPLNYAVTNVCIRRSLAHVPSLVLTLLTLVLASGVLLPLAALSPSVESPSSEAQWAAIASLAMLGVIGTGAATYMFNKLVQEHGPLFAGMVTYVVPVGALVWGWLDNETVTPLQLAALAGIFSMVAVVQYGAAGATVEALREPSPQPGP